MNIVFTTNQTVLYIMLQLQPKIIYFLKLIDRFLFSFLTGVNRSRNLIFHEDRDTKYEKRKEMKNNEWNMEPQSYVMR